MKKSLALLLASISLMLAVLACNFVTESVGLGSTPTPTKEPLPTITPLPPTEEVEVEIQVEPTVEIEPETETEAVTGTTFDVPPGELGVIALKPYQDEWDSWIMVGLVLNNTDRAVNRVEVELEVIDANGASIYKEVAYTALYDIAPGEISPFEQWVWGDIENPVEFKANVVGFGSTDIDRADVEIRGTIMTFGGRYVNVTGELVNNNDFPIEIDDLGVATFDANGELMTASADDVAIRYLAPGESGPFRATMDVPAEGAEAIVEYKFYPNAIKVDERPTYDISFLAERDYVDVNDNFRLVGMLQNNSEANLSLYLIAAIYDAAGNVIDASYVDFPYLALPPEERGYYNFNSWYPLNYTEGLIDQAESYTVQVDWGWTWESSTLYTDLVYSDAGFEYDSFWGLQFTGQVLNGTGNLIKGGKVIVILFSKQTGELLAMGYDTIFDDIPDDGSADYDVRVIVEEGFDMEGFDYQIWVKGELP